MTWRTLAALLTDHELRDAVETPLLHTGFSGATLTRLVRPDGAAFVLKRMSIERDWIMRATDDVACREAAFVAAKVALCGTIATPSIGVAQDGDLFALLMRDITPKLLPQGAISSQQLDMIIVRMAELHRLVYSPASLPWCDLQQRLTLLTPATAQVAAAYGAPVARDLVGGWRLFEQHASAEAKRIIGQLTADPARLLRALATMPAAFLHGDLKLDNIGLDGDGRMWLIDWAMTLVAPSAVELGWFLAINSRRLPDGVMLEDVMRRYGDAAWMLGAQRERHEALTVVCGLLLRGWRKALDAEAGEPEELRWWCERVEAAAHLLGL